jgi:hypothetical protein
MPPKLKIKGGNGSDQYLWPGAQQIAGPTMYNAQTAPSNKYDYPMTGQMLAESTRFAGGSKKKPANKNKPATAKPKKK